MKKKYLSAREQASNILFLYCHPEEAVPFSSTEVSSDDEDCAPRSGDLFRGTVSLVFLMGIILGVASILSLFA